MQVLEQQCLAMPSCSGFVSKRAQQKVPASGWLKTGPLNSSCTSASPYAATYVRQGWPLPAAPAASSSSSPTGAIVGGARASGSSWQASKLVWPACTCLLTPPRVAMLLQGSHGLYNGSPSMLCPLHARPHDCGISTTAVLAAWHQFTALKDPEEVPCMLTCDCKQAWWVEY